MLCTIEYFARHSRSLEMTPLSMASLLVFHCNYVSIFYRPEYKKVE